MKFTTEQLYEILTKKGILRSPIHFLIIFPSILPLISKFNTQQLITMLSIQAKCGDTVLHYAEQTQTLDMLKKILADNEHGGLSEIKKLLLIANNKNQTASFVNLQELFSFYEEMIKTEKGSEIVRELIDQKIVFNSDSPLTKFYFNTHLNNNELVIPVFNLLEKAGFTGDKIIDLIFHETTEGIRYEEFLYQAVPFFEKLADNEGLRQNLKKHLFKKNEYGVCFACIDNFLQEALPLFTKLKLNSTELSNAFSKTSFIKFLAENHKNNKLENVIPFIKTISSQNLLRLLVKEMSSVSGGMLNTISIFENKFITFYNRDQLIAFISDYLKPNQLREFLSQNLLTATLQSGLLPKEILAKAYGVDYDPSSIKENNNDLNTSISTWLKTKKDETELAKALVLPYYLGLSDLFQEGYRKLSPQISGYSRRCCLKNSL